MDRIRIGEAGAGDKPGRSVYDLSELVQELVAKGAHITTFGRNADDFTFVRHGEKVEKSVQDFAASELTSGEEMDYFFLNNVITADRSGLASVEEFAKVLPGLVAKLKPNGSIVIIENLLPDRARFLKQIPFEQFGVTPEWSEGERYHAKLREMRMRESPAVEDTGLFRRGPPFILTLHKKPTVSSVA